jgi:hypothetical protein
MMVPIWLRSFVDQLLHEHRQEDRLEPPTHPHRTEPPAHDITAWPTKLALPSRPRAVKDIAPLVTVHVTDVAGGFGVSRQQLKAAEGSYTTALLRRYHGAAYHRLVSRRVGLVTNHPLTLRTSHGNGGNRGAGWAIDCGHKEALGAAFIAAAQDSLEDLILDLHELRATSSSGSAAPEPIVVVPHCVFSKKRKADTSGTVWAAIVVPVIERINDLFTDGMPEGPNGESPVVCRIGYDLVEGGVPIPESWGPRVG